MRVNMNHAATSADNPPEVLEAVTAFLRAGSRQSAGRGGDELAAVQTALECRIALAEFFGAHAPQNVVFTSGATESLNMAINGFVGGFVRDGCHVLATGLEHNAVARPLHLLERQGRVEVTWLPCASDGSFDPGTIRSAVRSNTRLLVMTHASNVLGNVLPVAEAFRIAKEHGLLTLLDAAQTAGHREVRLDENTDAVAFAGHKGLRGLAGVGGLVLGKNAADSMRVWKAGGTGSRSDSPDMPDCLPDKFEAGTPNLLGIVSLGAAVKAITARGLGSIRAHEKSITGRFVAGLRQLPVTLCGNHDPENWTPALSVNIPGMDSGILARKLYEDHGITTRSGLHCAPLAHKTIGTFPQGTLRFSFGADSSVEEIDYALSALARIIA